MKALCENCRVIVYCIVKLLAIEVEEVDVCGSLVLSNPATYSLIHFGSVCKSAKFLFSATLLNLEIFAPQNI